MMRTVSCWPLRQTGKVVAGVVSQRRLAWSKDLTGWPLTATMRSPALRPAAAAPPWASTDPIVRLGLWLPLKEMMATSARKARAQREPSDTVLRWTRWEAER